MNMFQQVGVSFACDRYSHMLSYHPPLVGCLSSDSPPRHTGLHTPHTIHTTLQYSTTLNMMPSCPQGCGSPHHIRTSITLLRAVTQVITPPGHPEQHTRAPYKDHNANMSIWYDDCQTLHPMSYTKQTACARYCRLRMQCSDGWQPSSTTHHHNFSATQNLCTPTHS